MMTMVAMVNTDEFGISDSLQFWNRFPDRA